MLNTAITQETPPLVSNQSFARQIGRTPVTIWRWQKLGWLDASVNIAGKPYLTREAIERFTRRATAGEFAKAPHVMPRKANVVVNTRPHKNISHAVTTHKQQ